MFSNLHPENICNATTRRCKLNLNQTKELSEMLMVESANDVNKNTDKV